MRAHTHLFVLLAAISVAPMLLAEETAAPNTAPTKPEPPPKFRISSLNQLRAVAPAKLQRRVATPIPSGEAAPVNYYRQGQGVVLTPAAPLHADTGSDFEARQVRFSNSLISFIQDPQNSALPIELPGNSHEKNRFLSIQFRKAPSGTHSFMLTIGTTLAKKLQAANIGVFSSGWVPANQIFFNGDANEIRVLLLDKQIPSSGDFSSTVDVAAPSGYDGYALYYLHHVQLVQLD